MTEKSDVVEEVHHDSCVPAPGENIHPEIGMDDGNAEVSHAEDVQHRTRILSVGDNVHGHIGMDDGHVEECRQSTLAAEDDHQPTIVANNAPTIAGEKENVMRKRIDFTNPTPRSNSCDGEGEGLLLSNGVRPNPFPQHKLVIHPCR